ncbi:MAG: hypothetical protein AAFQ98_21905, partial [Bacteroidota bacterium]
MSVQILTELKPAEAYLILEHKKATFKELLRYTHIDLVVRSVLAMEVRSIEDGAGGEEAAFVSRGPAYPGYEPSLYEKVFITPFREDGEMEYTLSSLVRIAYENGKSLGSFVHSRMLHHPILSISFKQGAWQKITRKIQLNEYGQGQKQKLEAALNYLAHSLPANLDEHPEAVTQLLQRIGGNLYLLEKYDQAAFQKLMDTFSTVDQEYFRSMRKGGSAFLYVDSASYGAMDEDFSSGYDAVDGSGPGFGSGCSGDSGCSGCSGCGG